MKINKYSGYIFYSLLLIVASLLQSCSIGGKFLDEASSFKGIKKDEVIIVGRITLKPKL